jgi:basic membrane protein A and related proteins
MRPAYPAIVLLAALALILVSTGCTGPTSTTLPPTTLLAITTHSATVPDTIVPAVYIVYASEKGDQSYTDSAYQGLLEAEKDRAFTPTEFTLKDHETLPGLLRQLNGTVRPRLIITIGYQYTNYTEELAAQNMDIPVLAIDQAGIGSKNVQAYEITSYGDSYLAGVLAASATKSGRIGVIMGTQTELLDAFGQGYTDGARAVNSSIVVDRAYVQLDSPNGFRDPEEAGRIAEGMYRNGTDVIYTCAGYSGTGVFDAANRTTGRYVIGTDSDQSPHGPAIVLASAVKRVDRVVHTGVADELNGTFTGGDRVAGLREGATGIIYNPKFATYNETVSARETEAEQREAAYLASRNRPAQR